MANMKEILDSMADLLEQVEFKATDIIFKDQDSSREMYFITEGDVQIVKAISGGGNKILAVLTGGDIFGEGSLLTEKPRGASAQAVTEVKAHKLTLESFQKFLTDDPSKAAEMLIAIIQIVNSRLAYVNSELLTLYDVMRILSGSPDDLGMIGHDVLKKFTEVSEASEGALFLHNVVTEKEDFLVVSDDSSSDFVSEAMAVVNDKAKIFMENTAKRYEEGEVLWIPIRSFEGKFLGMAVLKNAEGEFTRDEIKLAIAITEQLGIAIQRHYSKEDDKERVRLKQEIVNGL